MDLLFIEIMLRLSNVKQMYCQKIHLSQGEVDLWLVLVTAIEPAKLQTSKIDQMCHDSYPSPLSGSFCPGNTHNV